MQPKSTCTCLHNYKTEIDDDLIEVDDDFWRSVNAVLTHDTVHIVITEELPASFPANH